MSASQRVSRGFHRFARTALIVSAAVLLAACNEADVYTLYRSSPTTGNISGEAERNHVATFDAAAGGDYNRKNCEIARNLFASQSGVTVRYWCEIDRFKP
jgi:hypothetical protein